MRTLHENLHSDMWYVFKMVSDCLDAVGTDEALGSAIRPLVHKINTSVVDFATRDKRVDADPVDATTCSMAELRAHCNAVKETSLRYINSLTDEEILDNPTNEVEGSLYFKLEHATFYSAVQIGKMHQILGIDS